MSFSPTILTWSPPTHLHWRGRLFDLPGLFTGHHHFVLHAVGEDRRETEMEQYEDFSGVLAWLLQFVGNMYGDTEQKFRRMNEGLKRRVEGDA